MRPKVLITLLTGDERQNWINPELALMLCKVGRDPRFDVEIANVKNAHPIEVARNHTIKLARDHGFDYLASFDNDNFMPVGTPLDIIATAGANQHVIGLRYAINGSSAGNGLQMYPHRGPCFAEGLFDEVSAVNGGVLIVRRAVWEKIPPPWFRWLHGEGVETLDQGPGGCSEDWYFCNLIRQHGFRVWTHRELLAGHYRTTDITGVVSTFAQMRKD